MTAPHPYLNPRYVAALEDGLPALAVPEWRSWAIPRPIPGGGQDAMGVYPMTPLATDADLEGGLARCRAAGLVSLVMVPDPLAAPDPAALQRAFPICRPFKTHYLIDRSAPFAPSRHHRERIRRGQRRCRIEPTSLARHLDGWRALYAELSAKRGIAGAAAFRPGYFEALAADPVICAFAAFVGDELAGMTLWFEHEGVVYNHLTASNAAGYANSANFALYAAAVEHFASGVINLGGPAGMSDVGDGLAQFKAGFANARTQAWLCGAVLDDERYARLAAGRETGAYFPAYRAPA